MQILANKDIKNLFLTLSGIWAAAFVAVQGILWLSYRKFSLCLLAIFLSAAAAMWVLFYSYFKKQHKIMEQAVSQINAYLDGDVNARIECDSEGEFYRLFHSVNALAAALNAHADNEQQEKEFLKNTISDISHQLKTPLAALNIYNCLIQDEETEMSSVKEFATLSEQELDRIETLVQNLLKITRLDAGTIVFEKNMENVSDMLQDLKLHFDYRVRQEQKRIILSGSDEVCLLCDRDWLSEAIGNIVKNALAHTEKGATVQKRLRHVMHTGSGKIETLLGINHAVSMKKNLILMTGSFALSIILFLSFSVIIDFVGYLMPQSVASSDIDIAGDNGNSIPSELLTSIRGMKGVKEVYGRRSIFEVPASFDGDLSDSCTVDLISYDDFDLQSLKKDNNLKKGSDLSKVYGNSSFVLATSDRDSTWKIGDTVCVGEEILTIAGLLKNDPFTADGLTNGKLTLITSDDTFVRLTGEKDYSLVMVQTTKDATDEEVQAIQAAVGETYSFQDKREECTTGTYMAFVFCVYVFLTIIALVTLLNIVNSISMSVSARMKQYGAMRAVGMDERQVTKMITAEAAAYAVLGCAVGCMIGLPVNKLLYNIFIVDHFPYAVWNFPVVLLLVILLFVLFALIAAVYIPAKHIRNMSITATINEL